MTWPLPSNGLSDGLSDGGRLSTCERQRTYTVDERHDGSFEAPHRKTARSALNGTIFYTQ
jgi:hypothetical protein